MPETTRFLTPDPTLAPGTTHAGFTVTSVEKVREISGCAYVMRHVASGARALWLACADTNKSFSISFKTPPADDTGVFHILEHSVLCGSSRYPVKEPFVNLLKSSMQTFLNAMTFPDKTMYPVASTNTRDLENLMGVYLDAVLNPAIYERPRIFEQEGWHLEVEGTNEAEESGGRLAYNGVVFNEMKGALSDPDDVLYQELARQLFPTTAYGFESGGNPRAIPTLTYETFLATHARHYNLANSYTILYGDMDIDRELALIDERFREAKPREAGEPNPLELQAPVQPERTTITMATASTNSSIGLAYVVGTAADRTRVMATGILLDSLCGSNEAPLKRRILDAGLADDFEAALVDGVAQPHVLFELKNLRDGASKSFRTLLEETCATIVKEGLDHERIAAALAHLEFNMRERDCGTIPDGIAISVQVMSSWLYDDDRPLDYLRYEDALAELKTGLNKGLFENLLREVVCESLHCAEVELVPVENGDADKEAAELAALRAQMSSEDLARVAAEVEALRLEQETPDSPEALATLPVLTINDIEPPAPEQGPIDVDAPLPCIAHELDTHGIDYVYHYFDLRRLAFEDLPYVGVLTALLGQLDTKRHTAAELDTLIEGNLGRLTFFVETYTRDDDPTFADPKLIVGASALSSRTDTLATIPSEVWGKTIFADTDRIKNILTQCKLGLDQRFVVAGTPAAVARVGTCFSAGAIVTDAISGVSYYLFLKDLLANFDEAAPELVWRLEDVARRIFVADDTIVSFVGPAADRDRFWQAAGTLGLVSAPAGTTAHALKIPRPILKNEAFVIPANVNFVVRSHGRSALDTAEMGTWIVASRAITFDYLWNEIRVKGGAYGCRFDHSTSRRSTFSSFRDPSIDTTLERYDGVAAWLDTWQPTDEEYTGYVVSSVASHDAPMKPRALARRQDELRFGGKPQGWRDAIRAQLLACTPEDVRGLVGTFSDATTGSAVCVFGGREAIESSKVAFDSVTTLVSD